MTDGFSLGDANEHLISAQKGRSRVPVGVGVPVTFGVLGPVAAWDSAGEAIALKGPRHRAVLARLITARRRVVPVTRLVEDLWTDPPPNAVGAVRTFVSALRRALEPERVPRTPSRLLVTEGPGYALRADDNAVDAWGFERAVAAATARPPSERADRLAQALGQWRGPAYADFADEAWARAERSRLTELRLHAVERRAEAQLAVGLAAEAVPDLDAHVTEHPWREDAWRLLALALYRTGRQADALAVLRRARDLLTEQLGVDPGPRLRRLESDILHQADHLDPDPEPGPGLDPDPEPGPGLDTDLDAGSTAEYVWAQATASYNRTVPPGARARLESTVGLLRNLAVTGGGGLAAVRGHRVAAVAAAEQLGDPELTARVIGSYDVPAIWTRSDDPVQAGHIVAAAERTLTTLPPGSNDAARARLLATIAVESRGAPMAYGMTNGTTHEMARGLQAARQAESIARRIEDPALLSFALNGLFMQSFHRTGLAPQRDAIGAELVALSARHGLVTYEVLGHLVSLQARSALADFDAADRHAAAADRLAERNELPLVSVFTKWYAALRLAATGRKPEPGAEAAYTSAAAMLSGAGMPGLEHGLLPLALLSLRIRQGRPAPADEHTDWGPYDPWARPLVLLSQGHRDKAAAALRTVPPPPRGLLMEALWCLAGQAAIAVGDRDTMQRAHTALVPAARELAGAGSGLLTLGPVSEHLDALAAALEHHR
jgi:DNA-binding SARP family transcriptional activator